MLLNGAHFAFLLQISDNHVHTGVICKDMIRPAPWNDQVLECVKYINNNSTIHSRELNGWPIN